MNRSPFPLLVPLVLAATAVAQKPVPVEASVKKADMTNRSALPIVAPVSETIQLSDKAPAGVSAPEGAHSPWFGTVEVQNKKLGVVLGKASADSEHLDALWLDANADGAFEPGERHEISTNEQKRGNATTVVGQPTDVTIAPGGAELAAQFRYQQSGERPPMALLVFPDFLEAKVDVGGQQRIVAVLDKDLDGKFGSKGDLWMLAKAGDRPASPYGLSLLSERRFDNGKLVGIKVTGADKIEVMAADAKGPNPQDMAAHRERVEHEWMKRFDKERDEFVVEKKMDTSRPKAKSPIPWNYVTFDEAIALGKQQGKPVFVDVMAFWCIWCYRLDYYTYPDAEVAALLTDKFVPVKLIEEQDVGNDTARVKEMIKPRGIPAMGIFDAEGNLVHKIEGWRKPEAMVEELQKGLAEK